MTSLGKSLLNLSRYRKQWSKLAQVPGVATARDGGEESRLVETHDFGSNPGNLRMLSHAPDKIGPKPALVVVLHGCTQTAAAYDHAAGWSALGDRQGFVVLYPEQRSTNNPKNCFTWFLTADITRDHGEALSIRQMITRTVKDHGIDESRIFITGLSAGGAMAAVMLATYPEVFAGGAVIAGLPYGAARRVDEAFTAMFQGKSLPASMRGDAVRKASAHRGHWPKISIWHGTTDTTVKSANADELVKQWTNLHGLTDDPTQVQIKGATVRTWRGTDGTPRVTDYRISGMGHGTPLDAKAESGSEHAAPFMLDVGLSSTHLMAEDWGLLTQGARVPSSKAPAKPATESIRKSLAKASDPAKVDVQPQARPSAGASHPASQRTHDNRPRHAPSHGYSAIESVINRALKMAGLIKS